MRGVVCVGPALEIQYRKSVTMSTRRREWVAECEVLPASPQNIELKERLDLKLKLLLTTSNASG